MAKIGFVGLGHMGLPMAANLMRAGHYVTGYDLEQSALEHFAQLGGQIADDLADAALGQDIIITMLQTGEQVLRVCSGPAGLVQQAPADSVLIDCSTIDVETTRALHLLAEKKQLYCIDAPVSGGVAGAAAGTLTFMVGGVLAAYQKAEPILLAMGKKIIHAGDAGSGQAAKICNNMILGISMIAISEAFTLAKHLGLSAAKLFEVVTNSSGQCWAMNQYVPVPGILANVPANNEYKPGFAAAMMLKDLLLSQKSAEAVDLQTPLGGKTTELYQRFIDQGHGELDFSAIIKLMEHQG